jgi:hypothetical protein
MGRHKSSQKERGWLQLLLCFLGGALLVAACLYRMAYYPSGIIGAHANGGFLGLGLVLMATPILAYFRRRKPRTRDSDT